MKKIILALVFLGFTMQAYASEVAPPRIVVEWLIEAVQKERIDAIDAYFAFDEKKHGVLTPLSRDVQLQLLKDLPLDKIEFDKDKYFVDEGSRFVVSVVSPKKLDFEMQYVELTGEIGPPWTYDVIAIREAQEQGKGIRSEKQSNKAKYEYQLGDKKNKRSIAIGELVQELGGSKIQMAKYRILEVVKGEISSEIITVGYYFYSLKGELPKKAILRLEEYNGTADISNYYLAIEGNAEMGIRDYLEE